jgi:serine protease Do
MDRPVDLACVGMVTAFLLPRIGVAQVPPSHPPLQADSISRIVEQVEPAVVSILRVRPPASDDQPERFTDTPFPRDPDDREVLPNDYGTGLLVKPPDESELYILTAYHVVRGGQIYQGDDGWLPTANRSQLRVTFHNRRSCAAAIFAADPRSDLAVLAFDRSSLGKSGDELRPIDWQASAPVRKGEFVICLGNPYALARDGSASVSWGIVSNLARRPFLSPRTEISEQLLSQLGTVLQIDSRLQLGGSGGPVVNLQGQLIGIATALAAIEGYEKSAGFAIPVAPPMRRVIQTLLAGQEVEYGLLGVSPATVGPERMKEFGLYDRQPSAVQIRDFPRGSPAEGFDRLQKNDVLLKINDQTLLSSADLMRVVGELPPETDVKIEFYRPPRGSSLQGQVLTCKSKLGKWPVRDDEGIVASRPKYPSWRGLRVDYPTARERFVRHEHQFWPGVIVVDVAAGSRAAQAQLQLGNVITHVQDAPVRTPGEFQRAVQKLRGDVVLQLYVDRPGDRSTVTLKE